MVDGVATSLRDLGYDRIGLDDGGVIAWPSKWHHQQRRSLTGGKACGADVNGSFHNAAGAPLIRNSTFPTQTTGRFSRGGISTRVIAASVAVCNQTGRRR
eukprot:m.163962 g.163962  ORF g.163962 m.163962 type:complete len:100 (-) comp23933_c0_seq7:1172-1471(-)